MTNVAKFKENKMWDNIKNIIGASAPVLGTLIGGPAGTAVGTLISKTLGVDNTPEAIELALRNNPDALLRIKELETSKELAILEAEHKARLSAIEDKRVDNEKDQMFLAEVAKFVETEAKNAKEALQKEEYEIAFDATQKMVKLIKDQLVEGLINYANEMGGNDNITALVIKR